MNKIPGPVAVASSPDLQAGGGAAASGALPVIQSTLLFSQGNAVRIEHAGQHYLLRITRENKLILTK